MEVKVIATQEEKLSVLHSALCGGIGLVGVFGLEADYDDDAYNAARERLTASGAKGKYTESVCYEDILIEMIRGGGAITLTDVETDDGVIGNISLATLEANWDKIPANIIIAYIEENYDAYTALNFIQASVLGELRYG